MYNKKAGQGVGVSLNRWGLNILKYSLVMELWWPVAKPEESLSITRMYRQKVTECITVHLPGKLH